MVQILSASFFDIYSLRASAASWWQILAANLLLESGFSVADLHLVLSHLVIRHLPHSSLLFLNSLSLHLNVTPGA